MSGMVYSALELVHDLTPIFPPIIMPEWAELAGVARTSHGTFDPSAGWAGVVPDTAALTGRGSRAHLYVV